VYQVAIFSGWRVGVSADREARRRGLSEAIRGNATRSVSVLKAEIIFACLARKATAIYCSRCGCEAEPDGDRLAFAAAGAGVTKLTQIRGSEDGGQAGKFADRISQPEPPFSSKLTCLPKEQ